MTIICPECGETTRDKRFCSKCGTDLQGVIKKEEARLATEQKAEEEKREAIEKIEQTLKEIRVVNASKISNINEAKQLYVTVGEHIGAIVRYDLSGYDSLQQEYEQLFTNIQRYQKNLENARKIKKTAIVIVIIIGLASTGSAIVINRSYLQTQVEKIAEKVVSGIYYLVIRPPKPDTWTSVTSGSQIRGKWEGKDVFPIQADEISGFPASTIGISSVFEYTESGGKIDFKMSMDIGNYLDDMMKASPDSGLSKDELFSEYVKFFFSDSEFITFDATKYTIIIKLTDRGIYPDQDGFDFFLINKKQNRIKLNDTVWQLPGIGEGDDSKPLILTNTVKPKPREYKLGEFGEAGVVFYDKGAYSYGWRYLECSVGFLRDTRWGTQAQYISGLKTDLGDGDFNTHNIINFQGEQTAAYLAASYHGGGKDDWYLGNCMEMQVLYKNLVRKTSNRRRSKKIDGFQKLNYSIFNHDYSSCWTSEQASSNNAFYIELQQFLWDRGGKINNAEILPHKLWGLDIDPKKPIRPIRKF
jgi:ribosomal protein L32